MADAALERAVARLFLIGFHGTTVTDDLRRVIDRGVTGTILFSRNVGSRSVAEVRSLCAAIKDAAGRPFLTSVDQEGGRVARLDGQGFTRVPPMREIGRRGDLALARSTGETLGRELRSAAIDLNFAPVLDVDTNPANPVIGARSLGPDPDSVARLGCAMIEGIQSQGVAACAKHFPGHGDTSIDSHLDLPSLDHDMARLRAIELPPFARAVNEARVACVMSAHVIFKAIDPTCPATMSAAVLDGLLRREFGFDGVIISDDLEMKAIADHYGIEQAVVRGALAGIDLFLVCHDHGLQHRAIDVLARAVQRGDVPRSRIDEAGRRVDELVHRYVVSRADRVEPLADARPS